MPTTKRIIPLALKSFDTTSLSASFQVVDAVGFIYPVSILKFINESDTDGTVSFDGITSHDFVLSDSQTEINFSALLGSTARGAQIAKKTKIHIKGSMGTGLFYVVAYTQLP